MKDIRTKQLRYLLYPLSLLYGVVVGIRNFLFDKRVIKSKSYPLPVIVVGNLTVGGTGKTPMTEYLIRLLEIRFKIAVLSRGYGRKSKGFVCADLQSTASDIGDEPCQMARKFPQITVAVDVDRRNGIGNLLKISPQIQTIVLDDAFQHRYVTPGLSILLMDCKRPIYEDRMLPYGDLREPFTQVKRADILIVTKCPLNMLPIERRIIRERLDLRPHQKLFFATLVYKELKPLKQSETVRQLTLSQLKEQSYSVLIVTAIAQNSSFVEEIGRYAEISDVLSFADHHQFTEREIEIIQNKYDKISNLRKCILITEKDAVRLNSEKYLSLNLCSEIYYLPIEVDFLDNESEYFNKTILDYVGKNKRDGFIH